MGEAEIPTLVPDAGVNFKFEILSECNLRKLRSTGPASGSRRMFTFYLLMILCSFIHMKRDSLKVLFVVESVFTRFGLVIGENKTKFYGLIS